LQRNVKEELSQLSHHMHNSAFCKLWFGQNLNGITSATPTDLMHAFCHGVLVYVINIILTPLNNQERSQLDSISSDMFWRLKSNQKNEFPRYIFLKGITKLTLLTASEWVGIIFVIYFNNILSRTVFWGNQLKKDFSLLVKLLWLEEVFIKNMSLQINDGK